MLLHVGLHAVVHLNAGVGKLPGQDVDQADFHRALGAGGRAGKEQRDAYAQSGKYSMHIHPPGFLFEQASKIVLTNDRSVESRIDEA